MNNDNSNIPNYTNPGLKKVIERTGSQSAAGRLVDVGQSAVSNWARGGDLPPDKAIMYHVALNIPLKDLVPELYEKAEEARKNRRFRR